MDSVTNRFFNDETIAGLIMIATALTVLEGGSRSVSTIIYIQSNFGVSPIIYAAILFIFGALLTLLRATVPKLPLIAFTVLTTPLLFYVVAAFFYFGSQTEISRSPLVMYTGLYIMLMRRTVEDAAKVWQKRRKK